jgi:hypothetical protein
MLDPADIAADKDAERKAKTRMVESEIDRDYATPDQRAAARARNQTAPGMDAQDPKQRTLAKHSADFISAVVRKDRGAANASRVAFHAAKANTPNVPKGLEQPCPTGDCSRANVAPTTCEATGGCTPMGGSPKVGRPRG